MRHFALSALVLGAVQPSLSATINVVVGGPGVLQFNPSFVNANLGDTIRFVMQQKNHTVTQSSFASPCALTPGGFDTGFVPVADTVTTDFPVAELQVEQTTPIWAYCRQANHCLQGMVFAVNPGDKFAAFQAAAMGGSSTAATSAASSTAASATIAPITTAVSTTAAPSATSTSTGIDHKIIVGGTGILAYSPPNITAQIGDTITFEFHQKNHTITASSFADPCRALSLTSTTGQAGFDSGFMPVADTDTIFPTYTIKVNDTAPIWAYCRQANHCGSGMVFAANAVESSSKSFEAFQALAKQLNGTNTPTAASDAQSIVRAANPTALIIATAVLSFLFL